MPVFPWDKFKPRDVIGKISPYDWPQDKAQVPAGQGLMPKVDLQNAYLIRQESYFYTTEFANLAYGAVATVITLPTDPDGDFWCESIVLQCYEHGTQNLVLASPKIQVEDIRTNGTLFYPYGRGLIFTNDPTTDYGGGLIQEMVFTRNGGIKVSMQNDTYAAAALDVYVMFGGWKEYQYASR